MSEVAEIKEQFVIDNDQKAEWALKKIREAREDQAKWKAFYKAQMAKVDDETDANVAGLEAMLREYFETVPHKATKTQESYQLPTGKLVIKKQEPEYERNDTVVINWLKLTGNKQYIKIKEELDWQGLKKISSVVGEEIATEDGEIIPGVKVIERPEIFKVEVK